MKKLISTVMAFTMLLALVACGGGSSSQADAGSSQPASVAEEQNQLSEQPEAEPQSTGLDLSDIKIGVLLFEVTGDVPVAITAYMDGIKAATGLSYEMVYGSNYDEQTNITATQNLISSGCDGIILCMDSGTASIVEECSMAGVYVAGFLCDFEQSFDAIKDNEYFLGTICDGAYDNSIIGEVAAGLVIEDGLKNVGVISFPFNYFPHKQEGVDRFNEVIDAHNDTVADDEKINVYETHILSFSPLEETYFSEHSEIDGIFSLAANFVYPSMVSAGRTDVKLYTTGYSLDDSEAFEMGHIGMMVQCTYESIVYPLALICNAIRGVEYADQPASAGREDCTQLYFTSVEELNAFRDNSFFFNADYSKAVINPEALAQLMPFVNSEATYADLVNAVNSCGFDTMM